ncbi:2Fe-2S iron-sulfur cluster-binding protein [Streptomyces sp. NPDC058382]|uniref:(2Fe-2S)-binding protein n=1 Tax=unclassified Streptomyces TaxID=2593676 RepID=UPI003643C0E5
MTNEDHAEQHGGWEPTPQSGEYDAEATAFVHLPPEDLANIPLAAPGQGYVPPMIVPLTPAAGLDPAATGSWVVQTPGGQSPQNTETDRSTPDAVHWPDPNQQQTPYGTPYGYPQAPQHPQHPQPGEQQYPQQGEQQYPDQYRENPAATGQWNFAESAEAAEPAGHTGQWQIPVADGDLPEESGEFSASALAAGWYADRPAPATLPGGAPAPWATQQPEQQPEPEPVAGGTPPLGTDLGGAPDEPVGTVDETPADRSEDRPDHDAVAPAPPPGPSAEEPDAAPDGPPEPAAEDAPPLGTEQPAATGPDAEAAADEPLTGPDATDADGTDIDATGTDATDTDGPGPDGPEATGAVPAPALDLPSEHPSASYLLHVNGADRPVTDAWIGESLLYVLRERLGLAGAKDGCSQGECGACNVQVDGRLVASCLVPAATAAGSEVRTVEGLAVDGEPSDVQRALADCGAVQCGFCIPGMAMTVHDLLEGNHAPSELETRQALCGNLCRCSGYRGVLDAVNEVIAGREAASDAATAAAPESAEQGEARIPHQAAPGAGSVQAHLQDGGTA